MFGSIFIPSSRSFPPKSLEISASGENSILIRHLKSASDTSFLRGLKKNNFFCQKFSRFRRLHRFQYSNSQKNFKKSFLFFKIHKKK